MKQQKNLQENITKRGKSNITVQDRVVTAREMHPNKFHHH